jgi:hypothetical protein
MYICKIICDTILTHYFLLIDLACGVINLFYNYFHSEERQSEYDFCLKKNKEVFDRVIVFEGRFTFEKIFALSKDYPNDINVFCNSDIYFTETESLNNIGLMECYALTRWDKKGNSVKFFGRPDSQDAWVFRGSVQNIKANFYPGMWGCDNRLAYEIQKAGYKALNTVPPPYVRLAPCTI